MKRKILASVLAGVLLLQMTAGGVFAQEEAEPAEDPAEVAEIEEEDAGFGTGTLNGNTYESEFFGFRIELDDSWEFEDRDSLNTISSSIDEIATDEIKEALDSGVAYIDMLAQNTTTYENINVAITKLPVNEALMFQVQLDSYMQNFMDTVRTELDAMGFMDIEMQLNQIEFAGKTVPSLKIKSYPEMYEGELAVYQTQIMIVNGSYMCNVGCTSYNEDTTDDLLSYCSAFGEDA